MHRYYQLHWLVLVCSPPEPPLHGGQTISEDKTTVTFWCEPGYSINGQSSLKCSEDGSGWNGEVPSCCEFYEILKSQYPSGKD